MLFQISLLVPLKKSQKFHIVSVVVTGGILPFLEVLNRSDAAEVYFSVFH